MSAICPSSSCNQAKRIIDVTVQKLLDACYEFNILYRLHRVKSTTVDSSLCNVSRETVPRSQPESPGCGLLLHNPDLVLHQLLPPVKTKNL